MDLKLKEGRFLTKLARNEIETHFGEKELDIPEDMKEVVSRKMGVFVKLNRYPNNALRGSAGYTEGIMCLEIALKEVSLSAATKDHRFHPLRKSELKTTVIEISLLSEPELIKVDDPGDYINQITIGVDGIIVEKDSMKGVLLPQTAVESRWNSKQFLSYASMATRLGPDVWLDPDAKVYRFRAQVFVEQEPRGKIIKKLSSGGR